MYAVHTTVHVYHSLCKNFRMTLVMGYLTRYTSVPVHTRLSAHCSVLTRVSAQRHYVKKIIKEETKQKRYTIVCLTVECNGNNKHSLNFYANVFGARLIVPCIISNVYYVRIMYLFCYR